MKRDYPLYLANQALNSGDLIEVHDKFHRTAATRVRRADSNIIERAIQASVEATGPMARMAPYEREAVLLHCVRRFEERAEELAKILQVEAGKPISDSRGEVARLIDTFRIAAREAQNSSGEVLNLEIGERTRGYRGFTKRVPVGPCAFITPFNFPLNLAAHKVAPALACGCPFVLKADSRTPVGALVLGEILAETDLPRGAFSIFPCEVDDAAPLTEDERFKLLSFTGSPKVGWMLKSRAGKKKVVLELGGNAACVVDEGTDLDDAVPRIIKGAFYQSGQSCISVQRILVHESAAEAFEKRFVAATQELKSGDPAHEETFVGPMINEDEAKRLEIWIHAAREAGADLLCGGTRNGAVHDATVLKNVPRDQKLQAEEAFGPVAIIDRFSNFADALKQVNDSDYGIHAGVFTPRIQHAFQAWDELEVGGVLINEIPSWRVDNLPYGGVKNSGIGREGIRYAIKDMTEIRSLVIRETDISGK